MRGLDERWEDIPDFIRGVGDAVWADRGLGPALRDYYASEALIRTPGGVSRGEAAEARTVIAALQEFPDLERLSEEVIWSGSEGQGFYASQRLLTRGTHLGDGDLGRASGRPVIARVIADRLVLGGRIAEEWRIRDTGAVLRQIGQVPRDWVAERLTGGGAVAMLTPETDIAGVYAGQGDASDPGARLADLLDRMMTADFSAVAQVYDPGCALAYPGGMSGHGHADADRFWLSLRAAFPDAQLVLHHVIGREERRAAPKAAVRWSLTGIHAGWGGFGAPTGAEVHVMGITQAEFGSRGLIREWTLYDEAAVWAQILGGAG